MDETLLMVLALVAVGSVGFAAGLLFRAPPAPCAPDIDILAQAMVEAPAEVGIHASARSIARQYAAIAKRLTEA
jgi:hypothetical protein